MAALTLNTGSSDTARLTWSAASVTPPTLGQNFLMVFAMPAWRTPSAASRRIFGIPASTGSGTDVYATMCLQWTSAGASAMQLLMQDSAGASTSFTALAFDSVASLTPALIVVRGVANSTDTDIAIHAEVYGQTPHSASATMTGTPLAPTTDGNWGWGDIATYGGSFTAMPAYAGTAVRGITVLPPVFCAYASAGAVPSIASVVALLKANIGNLLLPATFGSFSSMTIPGTAYTQGNAGGTASHTNYSIGTSITSSTPNALCVRNAAGSSINQVRYDASVAGSHLVVNPFKITDQYAKLVVADPVTSYAPYRQGDANLLSQYLGGQRPRLHTCITGQSWVGGQGSSPMEDVGAGLHAGNDLFQGYVSRMRSTIVGARLLVPIQPAPTATRQQQYRIGIGVKDSNGNEDTYASGATSLGLDALNYEDWQEWGSQSSGPYASGSVASNGGLAMVGSYTDTTNASFQCGFDMAPFPRIGLSDPVTVEAQLIRYGGGPVAVVVSGETRPVDDIHGTSATAAATFTGETVSCDNGEGTARDLVSVSNSVNVATVVFGGAEGDIDAAEVAAAQADPKNASIPRWCAYIDDTVTGKRWLKTIRTATWDSGASEWTITFTPAFHYLPTEASTTKVRCSHWTLATGSASGVQDGSSVIRGVRVAKTGASGGGPLVCPTVGWYSPTKPGEIVSSVCAGSYAYHVWDTLNAAGLFARLMAAVGTERIIMCNTAVPLGAGNYEAAIARFRAAADSVIGLYIPKFQASFTDATPIADTPSREDFRRRCQEAGIPYYDLVVAGGHTADNSLQFHFQDPTHFSAAGYYNMVSEFIALQPAIVTSEFRRGGPRSRATHILA